MVSQYDLWLYQVYEPYLESKLESKKPSDGLHDSFVLDCLISEILTLSKNIDTVLCLLTKSPKQNPRNVLPEARYLASLFYRSVQKNQSFLHWCIELKQNIKQQLDFCVKKRIEDFVNAVPIGGAEPRLYDTDPIICFACENKFYKLTVEEIYRQFVYYRLRQAEAQK